MGEYRKILKSLIFLTSFFAFVRWLTLGGQKIMGMGIVQAFSLDQARIFEK